MFLNSNSNYKLDIIAGRKKKHLRFAIFDSMRTSCAIKKILKSSRNGESVSKLNASMHFKLTYNTRNKKKHHVFHAHAAQGARHTLRLHFDFGKESKASEWTSLHMQQVAVVPSHPLTIHHIASSQVTHSLHIVRFQVRSVPFRSVPFYWLVSPSTLTLN